MTKRNEAVKGKADKHCALLPAVATTKAAISKYIKAPEEPKLAHTIF